MARYQQLFLYVISLVIIYMILTRSGILPASILAYPAVKVLKMVMGLAIGIGGLVIYFRRTTHSDSNHNSES